MVVGQLLLFIYIVFISCAVVLVWHVRPFKYQGVSTVYGSSSSEAVRSIRAGSWYTWRLLCFPSVSVSVDASASRLLQENFFIKAVDVLIPIGVWF